jgi:type III restriction enzyme
MNRRFSDLLTIVMLGITIRARLRVLLPQDPETHYRLCDLVPPHMVERLGWVKIVITKFHPFKTRKQIEAYLRGEKHVAVSNGELFVY